MINLRTIALAVTAAIGLAAATQASAGAPTGARTLDLSTVGSLARVEMVDHKHYKHRKHFGNKHYRHGKKYRHRHGGRRDRFHRSDDHANGRHHRRHDRHYDYDRHDHRAYKKERRRERAAAALKLFGVFIDKSRKHHH